ncbi:hypothetical protein OF363_02920, partial [Mycoplasma enhydrae]
ALEAANNTKNELEPKKDNFKAEFKELENKIKIAEQKQADILARKNQIDQERNDAKQQLKDIQKSFEENSNHYDTNKDNLAEVEKSIAAFEKNKTDIEKLLQKLDDISFDDPKVEADALKTNIINKLTEARNQKSALETAAEQERQRIGQLKQNLNTAKEALKQLTETLNKAVGLDDRQTALDALESKLAEVQN